MIHSSNDIHQRGPHHYLLMLMGWPLLGMIAVVLGLRWRDVDQVVLVAIVALTPFLILPLIVADVAAWFSRSRALRLAAVAVTAACLFTIAPFDAMVGCGPSSGEGAITVWTANVLASGGRAGAIAANIAEADPDVILLQEVNSQFLGELSDQQILEAWSHRSTDVPDIQSRALVWSKWPLIDTRRVEPAADHFVRAEVDAPQGRFVVAALHIASPISSEDLDLWHEQFETLGRLSTAEPTVMGGDFNATEDHRPFRNLLDRGWTDVHDDKGCGPDFTWPTRGLPFPVMRLDHILVTDHFDVLSTEIGDPGGSDHHPVISRIRFTDS